MDSFAWREILTSVSILVVFATFVVGYLERRACDRRRRTLRFLLAMTEGEGPTNRAHLEIATWIRRGRVIEDDLVDSAEDKTIITVLDYYDVISDTAMRGVIDEEMIILHLGGRMRSTYKMLAKYIEARRKNLKRQGLYRQFQKFVVERIKDREV